MLGSRHFYAGTLCLWIASSPFAELREIYFYPVKKTRKYGTSARSRTREMQSSQSPLDGIAKGERAQDRNINQLLDNFAHALKIPARRDNFVGRKRLNVQNRSEGFPHSFDARFFNRLSIGLDVFLLIVYHILGRYYVTIPSLVHILQYNTGIDNFNILDLKCISIYFYFNSNS